MDVVISEKEIKVYEKLKFISEIVPIREKIKLFERKYNCSLDEFEKVLKEKGEDFEAWDDYIEWKAYVRKLKELQRKLREIEGAKGVRIA